MRKATSLESIRKEMEGGGHERAIRSLEALLSQGLEDPALLRLLALGYLHRGDRDGAMKLIAQARELEEPSAANEIAFGRMLNAKGFLKTAGACFSFARELEGENATVFALLAMNFTAQGKRDEALEAGQRSLELRDREALNFTLAPVELTRPRAFDAKRKARNIISYSLFGKDSYYWDSAVAAASMAIGLFPEWTCRFYCGPEIPDRLRTTLVRLGAQVMLSPQASKNWSGLFWRFWAFDDPNVDVVLVRDVDAPMSLRERLAVEDWLASDYPFHVIRDHIHHMEPMMAGLWGGWTGLLPKLQDVARPYLESGNERYKDQAFLRRSIWPRIRKATLAHDRHYNLLDSRPLPPHSTAAFLHIGGAYPRSIEGRGLNVRGRWPEAENRS